MCCACFLSPLLTSDKRIAVVVKNRGTGILDDLAWDSTDGGILEREGHVHVSVVPDVSAATLLKLTVKKVLRVSAVYTDKFRSYDSLMFCGYRHLKVDHQKDFSSGRVCINGLEGFWSWAKERLMKHHGVSRGRFPLCLKELEFRYNYRTGDLFDEVANYLCDLVPKRD